MIRRIAIVTGFIAALIAAGVGAYAWKARSGEPAYRFGKIERGTVTAVVSATGTLNPVVSVQVGSQVSGQIRELYADFNSPVKKGQLIARIDSDSFTLRVHQAMADLEAARATVLTQRANVAALQAEVSRAKVNLADAEREFKRNQILVEKKFVSEAARDKAQAAFEAAREQVKTAQAQLEVGQAQIRNVEALVKQREAQLAQAKVDLERTSIRAPVDGIVVKKSVEPGQTVAASLQAPELFVIAQDLREMQVETSIDEAEVGRVKVGQAATFTVDSFPGRTFQGTVSQVRKAATVVQNVVTYVAVVGTANQDLSLFPGMTANVRIVVDTRQNVLRVPNAALRFRPAGAAQAREGASEPGVAGTGTADAGETKGRGAPSAQKGQAARERLVKELKLNAEQQGKLDAIMNETRARIQALADEDQTERRRQAERLRAESRARIAEILDPDQRARYEAMGPRTRGAVAAGRVWVLDERGKPKAVQVRVGLTDGTYSELVSGPLAEGAEIILATADAGKRKQATGGPRFF